MDDYLIIWLVLLGVPMAFGLWAQVKVKSTFKKYSTVRPMNGMTGNQAAQAVLDASGLDGVSIHPVDGHLTDHYNPRNRTPEGCAPSTHAHASGLRLNEQISNDLQSTTPSPYGTPFGRTCWHQAGW